MAVVHALHAGQQDKFIRIHLRGDQPREFIIVGEHQLFNRDGVVFVDDGNDVLVLQRLAQQPRDVEIVLARLEILPRQ